MLVLEELKIKNSIINKKEDEEDYDNDNIYDDDDDYENDDNVDDESDENNEDEEDYKI